MKLLLSLQLDDERPWLAFVYVLKTDLTDFFLTNNEIKLLATFW